MIYSNSKRIDMQRLLSEIVVYKDRLAESQERVKSLKASLSKAQITNEKQKAEYKEQLARKDAIIKEQNNKLAHLTALMQRNGSNSGLATASTPINQKKHIPNSRRSSEKNKGGQEGHPKYMMESFEEGEITEVIEHDIAASKRTCNACGSELLATGQSVSKDEFEVKIKVVKKRHHYPIWECPNCQEQKRQAIPQNLKEQNQYGPHMKALALSLMITGNVAINKVRMLINGMTQAQMTPSEGFICKLYKKAALMLTSFMQELKKKLIGRTLIYWDETVIMIQTHRACLRFYGDENISYYTAHERKNLNGIIEDNILPELLKQTIVMHDHNKVNYNDIFSFQNIECNAHLARDLQKVADDNPRHTWAVELKAYISQTIKERKELIEKNETTFPQAYVSSYRKKVEQLLKKGRKESAISTNPATTPSESTLINRIEKYFENYFRWVEEFNLPTTDNLSERGLRSIKSHMKIAGQFQSVASASYYAIVKTYVETCRKNGINELYALSRLCAGSSLTVSEILR